MAILFVGSVLLGVVLGRFFKVLVLVPACALVFAAVLIGCADVEHGLLRPFLHFALLNATLQIGYVSGLLSHCILSAAPRKACRRALPATPLTATQGAATCIMIVDKYQ